MLYKQLLSGALVVVLSTVTLADDQDDDDEGGIEFAIGLVAGYEQSIYVGGDNQFQLQPDLYARWGRYFFEEGALGAYIHEDDSWSVSASLSLEGIFEDKDRDDSDELSDMEELDTLVMGQIGVEYGADWGEVELSLRADVSGAHDGYEAEIEYAYPIQSGNWVFEPAVFVEWVSKEVNQYYWGVSASEARPGRAFYEPDAGVNYGAEFTVYYFFNQHHGMLLSAEYNAYSDEVTDSPIVDEDNNLEGGVGYFYRF